MVDNIRGNQKGFTLIEVMAAVLILSIVTISLYTVYDYSIRSYGWGARYASAQEQGRFVMQKITTMAKSAFDVCSGDDGRRLDLLTDENLADSFDDNNIWNGYGESSQGVAPAREKDSVTFNTVSGNAYYLESSFPFGLIKPTTGGHLQVEVIIDASRLTPGSKAAIYFVAPDTQSQRFTPGVTNSVGVQLEAKGDGTGVLSIVEKKNGVSTPPQTISTEPVDITKEHSLRVGLKPTGYSVATHNISIYFDNNNILKDKASLELVRDATSKQNYWAATNNLAFVRFGIEAPASRAELIYKKISVFYNSYKFFVKGEDLYYQQNEDKEQKVADSVYKFNVQTSDNLANIELGLKYGFSAGKEDNAIYTLRSNVSF